MIERKTYKGILNGVSGIFSDKKPEGLELKEEITWYSADKGKVFTKNGKTFKTIVLKDSEKIKDYVEIDEPEKPTKKKK